MLIYNDIYFELGVDNRYSYVLILVHRAKESEGKKMKYSIISIRSESTWDEIDAEDRRELLRVNTFTSKNRLLGYKEGISEDYDVTIVRYGKGVPTKELLDKIAKLDAIKL